jgi:hypothetical protein
VFVVENNKFISKVNVVENRILTLTFLHSNEHHFHLTIPNKLNLIKVDKQFFLSSSLSNLGKLC